MKSELLRRPHKFWSQGQKLNFWMMDAGLGGVGEVNLSNILCLGHLPTAIIKHVLPNFQLSSQTLSAANFSVPRQSTLILVWDVARVWTGWLQHLEGKCSRKPEAWQVVGKQLERAGFRDRRSWSTHMKRRLQLWRQQGRKELNS